MTGRVPGRRSATAFGALTRTELFKLMTTRSWWGVLLALCAWAALWTALSAAFAGVEVPRQPPTPGPDDPGLARSVYTSGLTSFGYVFTLVLGVLAMGSEYRHQTVTPTFLATPRRHRVVLAKSVATTVVAVGYGVAALTTSVGVGALVVSLRGFDVTLTGHGIPAALALSVLTFPLWGLMGVGLATLVHNQLAAILTGIGFVAAETITTGILVFQPWGPDVLRWFPSQATSALVQPSTAGVPLHLLPPWAGAAVLVALAAGFSGVGVAATLRRDVT